MPLLKVTERIPMMAINPFDSRKEGRQQTSFCSLEYLASREVGDVKQEFPIQLMAYENAETRKTLR
jgi:hypothetical protein